ncbi:hypothetical protein IWW48_004095 [Coemansia sp. RSA 1200]|nr:hypothetical protein IWW48_004095 [Coemansia sp. RSA 1200]
MNIDSIVDVEVLRSYLHETTMRLQAAAQMGLELAQQNGKLCERLQALEEGQSEMRQWMGLVERDRRWMQEQSLCIDQVRASIAELTAKAEGYKSHREASGLRVERLDRAVEKMKEDIESLAQAADTAVSRRKWAADTAATHRSLNGVADKVAMLDARLAEMQTLVDAADGRHRSQTTEFSRAIGAAMQQMQEIGEERDEAQLQIDSVASNQREIERSLQSVIHEYNSMLNNHEQAIRALGERQAVLETQAAAAVGDGEKQRHAGRRQPRLQPQKNHPSASAPPQHQQYESIGDILEADRLDSMMTAMMMYPDKRRVSGTRDSCADGLDLSFPSPPLSTTSADCYHSHTLPNNYSLHQELGETTPVLERSPMRKATSVVGTSNEPRRKLSPQPPPPRLRARNSSFSRLAEIGLMNKPQHNHHHHQHASLAQMILVSPTRPAATSGFSNIISTTSHVGVGWGNYWEARRHRLQFDIQKRFGLPTSASETSTSSSRAAGAASVASTAPKSPADINDNPTTSAVVDGNVESLDIQD